MKRQILFFVLFLVLNNLVFAQTTFQKRFGGTGWERGQMTEKTNDGGIIIAGYTSSYDVGSGDFILIKLDASFNYSWSSVFGGASTDWAFSVCENIDNGFTIAGYTTTYGAGGYDIFLVRTNSTGNMLWSKTYGGASTDRAKHVFQLPTGEFIVTGDIGSFGSGCQDVLLMKTDINGTPIWQKVYGRSGCDYGDFVEQTSDGGFIITGRTGSIGAGGYDLHLLKTDAAGNVVWWKAYGGAGNEAGGVVRELSGGGYIVTGVTTSFGAGAEDIYVVKTDANGNLIWARTYGGALKEPNSYSTSPKANSIIETSDGCYLIAAQTYSFGFGGADGLLLKINADGGIIWDNVYGGTLNDQFEYVYEEASGGFTAVGSRASAVGFGSADIWLVKTLADGTSTCEEQPGATIMNNQTGATTVTSGTAIVGSFSNSSVVVPTVNYPACGNASICFNLPIELLSFNAINEDKSVKTIWTTASEINNDYFTIMRSDDGIVFEEIGMIQGAGTSNITLNYEFIDENPLSGLSYYKLMQTDYDGTSSFSEIISVERNENKFVSIYPNPATNYIILTTHFNKNSIATIEIFNSFGQIVSAKIAKENTTKIDISSFASGVYFVKVITETEKHIEKLIIN
jgi:Secretion system C-terminal sorting domain